MEISKQQDAAKKLGGRKQEQEAGKEKRFPFFLPPVPASCLLIL